MANSLQELDELLGEEIVKESDKLYLIEKNAFLLRRIRQDLKLSQADVAKKSNISQSTVSAIERKGNNLTLLSFVNYIQSIGGELEIIIRLPDGKIIHQNF